MGDWIEKKLSEVCTISIGGTPARAVSEYWDVDDKTENFWVSIRDMNQKVIQRTSEKLSQKGIQNSNAKLVRKGTVLMSFKLSIGKVSIAGSDLFTNEAIAALEITDIDREFLFHGLHYWDLLQGVDQAVKGATLNKEKLKKIKFKIPKSKEEQSTIATILTSIDQAIEKTEQLIAKYERIKTGLMQDLLTRGIDEQGNIRSEETHEFKNSVLGRIPMEWEVCKLKTHLDVIDCKHVTPNYVSEGVPIIRPRNVTLEGIDFSDMAYVSYSDFKFLMENHIPQKGDIIFTRNASFGNSSFLDSDLDLAIGQDMVIITPVNEEVNSKLIFYQLNFSEFQNQVLKLSGGSTFGRINLTILRELLIKFPPKPEQDKIEEVISSISKNIEEAKAEAMNFSQMKKGLMQDLLTGKVRVDALLKEVETGTFIS